MRGMNNIRRRSIWICDSDSMYLNMLHGYLKERIGLPLDFAEFTDVKYLKEKPENEEVLLLIISEEYYLQTDREAYANILVLSESSGRFQNDEDEGSVYSISRYSKATDILDAVLSVMSESKQMKELCLTRELAVHVIGFYSPLGRCLQTATALAMGELLAEKEKTLYLNFAPFPEERLVNLGHGENLADLVYYYGCDPESLTPKLFRAVADVGGLKVIPPAPSYMQIADVGEIEWMSFIREICKVSDCKYLILDLSEALPCLFELLGICEQIYTICGHDKYDEAKIISYQKYLSVRNQTKLAEKTVFMKLPHDMNVFCRLSELSSSELGEFLVRSGFLPDGIARSGRTQKAIIPNIELEDDEEDDRDEQLERRKPQRKPKRKLFAKRETGY